MRAATVYRRQGTFFVHALAQMTDGPLLLCEPVFAVLEEEGEAALGRAVSAALDGFRVDVAPPQSWKGLVTPLLAVSGVRSWAAFARSAECVGINEEDGRLGLAPTRKLGARGGFEYLTEVVHAMPDDPARLGALIVDVLRFAK